MNEAYHCPTWCWLVAAAVSFFIYMIRRSARLRLQNRKERKAGTTEIVEKEADKASEGEE